MLIMCMSSTHGGQKTISDAKELELHKAVNRHMDAGSSNCWNFSLLCASFFLKPFYLFIFPFFEERVLLYQPWLAWYLLYRSR